MVERKKRKGYSPGRPKGTRSESWIPNKALVVFLLVGRMTIRVVFHVPVILHIQSNISDIVNH